MENFTDCNGIDRVKFTCSCGFHVSIPTTNAIPLGTSALGRALHYPELKFETRKKIILSQSCLKCI